MRSNNSKSMLKAAVRILLGILPLAAIPSFGQQQLNLTAGPATATLQGGNTVPMWGYSCGTAVSGSTATCASLNTAATTAAIWSPVLITVPLGQDLQINLTNSLVFGTNMIPTSLVIVGQVGGGLGTKGSTCTGGVTCTDSPDHSSAQAKSTWPSVNNTVNGTPPVQGPRVQSFSTEVVAGATASLTWTALRPGTYLLESGTHPSIQGPMGLYGIVVVTTPPPTATSGFTAYPGVTYDADVKLLFSEIDPVQNNAVNTAVNTAGFDETIVWSGQPGGCGDKNSPNYHKCYPPAVNYSPLYYMINGIPFSKANASASLFTSFPASVVSTTGGTVLVRMVNSGLRMHVPSIVGSQTGASATPGFSLIAEDGNPLPGVPRVQSEVFMAAGKTYDVMINVPTGATALPVYDRELSLSSNSISRDGGMLAYISVNGAGLPGSPALGAATANPDTYSSVISGQSLIVSDPAKGVIANDVNIYSVQVVGTAPAGLTLNANGTFVYNGGVATSFMYCGNGATSGSACANVTLGLAPKEAASGITCTAPSFSSNVSSTLSIKPPGVLAFCKDVAGYPLVVSGPTSATPVYTALVGGGTVSIDMNGGFTASSSAGTRTFTFQPKNSQGTVGPTTVVTLNFPTASNLAVTVLDGQDRTTKITDYRWIIEEDRTFYVDPKCTSNPPPAGCPVTSTNTVPVLGVNFHTSYMPVVAQGCTGTLSCESGQTVFDPTTGVHVNAVCDLGNGVCHSGSGETPLLPSAVNLDPTKRYYISVLPGDAANPFNGGYGGTPNCTADASHNSTPNGTCGHGMGGAPIVAPCAAGTASTCTTSFAPVIVLSEPSPYQSAELSVFVYEDDFPLNGEQDAGGGIDVLATNEPGLGSFQITLYDDAGGTGDATGTPTYDMFNMPLTNSLAGTQDPATGNDACPITKVSASDHITGMIVTCPKFESDGKTLSPLAGQALVVNLYPGRYGVVATPGADRIARGEEWLQTNTLDGQKAHDSFLRIGEPSYFQEFGPAGHHVSIGFANPALINARKAGVCAGTDPNLPASNCNNIVTGMVTNEHYSRSPDERLYSSGSYDAFSFTQCYISLGDPDGEDFAFTKCNPDGTFMLSGIPDGTWRVTVFDQWNDLLVDGLSTPVALSGGHTLNMGEIAINQWHANLSTSTFFDQNGDGVRQDSEPGLTLVPTNIRFRDGSFSNFNNTDLSGNAGFNEEFPLFAWYVVEADTTRYKNTGTHVVYDSGGPTDGSSSCGQPGYPPCGTSTFAQFMATTNELVSVPTNLRVPGAVYCANADCSGHSIASGPSSSDPPASCTTTGGATSCNTTLSTGRIDPPWVLSEGWQGFAGQNSFLEFGKKPYAVGENGGIRGHVVYASTRPFDDPQLLLQTSWEPLVPGVTINLYQEGTAPDGSQSLVLVDTTKTSSWDAWAQGFRSDGVPNMNCPGQSISDLFFFTLQSQPSYLDYYNSQHGGSAPTALPNNSQFKCYDGLHNWNQLQPAPYDGMYQFPSIVDRNPTTGVPQGIGRAVISAGGSVIGTNCTICKANPTDNTPMLPAGKYVVEVVVPSGYELVKEEDKNILIGDNYIASVTQEFGGLSNIFILPDQAAVADAYNGNNAQNSTNDLGASPRHEGDTGSVETFWPCVGASRIIPDYISLFPGSKEVSPFAGATRNLCDRKEVTLEDQSSSLAKFYIFTSTHVSAHFTGIITDDFTSEFDPFSPMFGEKFSPANQPISIKDFNGNEISRIYSDWWGAFDGLNYSTWEVNPPNPTGYAPTMMVTCMNDPGPVVGITDPLFDPAYSQFCYEIPFMPGQTQYMDTPVVPTSAFAGAGYNNPDCEYPASTPAIASVTTSDIAGPWLSTTGTSHTITIKALGDKSVYNNAYSGPSATTSPFNQKTITRHYGFGTTAGTVTVGGVAATISPSGWSDSTITATLPANANVPNCAVLQQTQYGAPATPAKCGELVITAANGRQSVDTVTITIGGKTPTVLGAGKTIQSAIDAATPGDMIIIPPGTYNEILLMWKPVRLQGVGAASSVINANTQPAGKLDPWRRSVNCLFGLALNGQPLSAGNPFDSTGTYSCPNPSNSATGGIGPNGNNWRYFYGGPNFPTMVVDRIPLEGILGWDTTVNGNLAEMLQEPSLMGAYEGAGITVLSKGVNIPAGATDVFGSGAEANFPANSTLLTGTAANPVTLAVGDNNVLCRPSTSRPTNLYPSNFMCNPSSIDGLSITDASQGGGGILVHAWGHNLQIANNRIYNNIGTLSGGVTIGQGETPDAYLNGTSQGVSFPGSCATGNGMPATAQMPYCFDLNVSVHHNQVKLNMSIGDELFTGTPAGAGGVSICTGADYYKFNYNWVCGNMSTGDGGGIAHLGFSYNGDIEHNSVLFNQSVNPTIATNGGGIIVMGAPPDGQATINGVLTECGSVTDVDCVPGLSDGAGPGLVINANLIQGNGAESGSGGGLRLQAVNGTDVSRFPGTPANWYSVLVINNIISNNVAGWDGAGISLEDSLVVNIINNTIASNDTTASAGPLFNTLGAPLSSSQSPTPTCLTQTATTSCPQPAGLVTMQNSPQMISSFTTGAITCPAGHYAGNTASGGSCTQFSYPLIANDVFWQNRAFYIGVGALSAQYQQNVVSLFNASGSAAGSQTATGACPTGASYWDIGVRGDTGPSNHGSGITLGPSYTFLTDAGDYGSANNSGGNPAFTQQYCNGSRIPPENGGAGYMVPPGIADATMPNPIFNLTPAATVDEGNNWINMAWGPLSLLSPVSQSTLSNYSQAAGSPVINYIPSTATANFGEAPNLDFFGNARKTNNLVDAGAVEFGASPGAASATATPNPLNFGNQFDGITSSARTLTITNTGTVALVGGTFTFGGGAPQPFARANILQGGPGNCAAILAVGASCTFNVVFTPPAAGSYSRTLTINYTNVGFTGVVVNLTGTGVAQGTLSFTAATNGTLSGSGITRALTFTIPTPRAPVTSVVTITNTGAAPLQITAENLAINFGGLYSLTGTTCSFTTPLAPSGTCTVSIRYSTPATRPTLPDGGAMTVANNGSGTVGGVSTLGLIAQ